MPGKKSPPLIKDYSWLKGIFLVVLLVALIDLSIYFLIGPRSNNQMHRTHEFGSKMTNWQVYSSQAGRFAFRYPQAYSVTNGTPNPNSVQIVSQTTPAFMLTITYKPAEVSQTLDQLIAQNRPCAQMNTKDGTPSTINGENPAQTFVDTPCGQNLQTVVYTLNHGMFYMMTVESSGKFSDVKPYTDQILATLRFFDGKNITPSQAPTQTQSMCTMDARQCPDGSWVGRSGPKCEFVCPK